MHTPLERMELVAPAGSPDAGFAALQYGADAVFLGLKKFSARADAENFTLDELDELTAYAHGLERPRRVFVTLNTLILEEELDELVELMGALDDIRVDALVIQDLGVLRVARKYFPRLCLHASTQMAVHNAAGAQALEKMGFARVILSRELTLKEIAGIVSSTPMEVEVFVHGALCYSYSGLCLYSSHALGRSGNRGRCAQLCRVSHRIDQGPRELGEDPAFPFSMKDLSLADWLQGLREAGVTALKIEGRKKSALYVAAVTDFYRRLLDGAMDAEERAARESDLKTIFSRPWTDLWIDRRRDKEVVDRDIIGHRGAPIGKVESVVTPREGGAPRLRFRTSRRLELHDGLQIDIAGQERPFGFAVEKLRIAGAEGKGREGFEAPSGSTVEVELPPEYAAIPAGAVVYCSSSQEVKNRFRHVRPREREFLTRLAMRVIVEIAPDRLTLTGRVGDEGERAQCSVEVAGPFERAKNPAGMEEAVKKSIERLGDTRLKLSSLEIRNPEGLFVPVSTLNRLRRDLTAELEKRVVELRNRRTEAIKGEVVMPPVRPARSTDFLWSVKTDRVSNLSAFDAESLAGLEEIVVDVQREGVEEIGRELDRLCAAVGRERIRLALPAITRAWEVPALRAKIEHFMSAGWKNWEAANLSAWPFLGVEPSGERERDLSLACDWSIYVTNRQAALQALSMGASRFTLSPEDGIENMRRLLAEFAERAAVIVYQDTPLFISESCAYANLAGKCPGRAECPFEAIELVSAFGDRVTALQERCRTALVAREPFSISGRLNDLAEAGARRLRVDFVWRRYEPRKALEVYRAARAGRAIEGTRIANFERGMI